MTTTRKQGSYYLRKAIQYWKDLGWEVEKLEVPNIFFIGKKIVFGGRKDLLGADACVWKGDDVRLIQVKSTENPKYISKHRSEAKTEFSSVPIPKYVMIYVKGEKPIIEQV